MEAEITFDILKKLSLSFPEVIQQPHFEKTSFRVKNKIFLTYDEKKGNAIVKLSKIDQDVFSSVQTGYIYPVGNKWGKQGWTVIELNKVNKDLFEDIIITAYCEVAPKKLAIIVRLNKSE